MFADANVDAVTEQVNEMRSIQNSVGQWRSQAKKAKRLKVVNCLDEKLRRMQGLMSVSSRAETAYKKSLATGESTHAVKYSERVLYAHRRATTLVPQSLRCWCQGRQEQAAGNTKIRLPGKEKREIGLVYLCNQEGSLEQTLVKLQVPDNFEEIVAEEDSELVDANSNFGFPEIPAASPFR